MANRKKIQQRIVVIAATFRRYQEGVNKFRQDRMFQNNQRQVYRELNQEGERCHDDQPDAEESKKNWETRGVNQVYLTNDLMN